MWKKCRKYVDNIIELVYNEDVDGGSQKENRA